MVPPLASQSPARRCAHGSSHLLRVSGTDGIPAVRGYGYHSSSSATHLRGSSFTSVSRVLCSKPYFKTNRNQLTHFTVAALNKTDLLVGKYGYSDSWSRDTLRRLRNGRAPRRKDGRDLRVHSSLSTMPPEFVIKSLKIGLSSLLSRIPASHPLLSLPLSHPAFLIPPALCSMAFAIWGLGPTLRFFRKLVFRRDDGAWEESKTKYLMAFYIRPIILWISMLVICHGLDPIILKSPASHAIKERFLNFVRSLSTVLTFAFCTASLTQQIQKFVERSTSPEATRNLGVQFVGNTVYTLVWIAAVILFMELLGFSTQKWITAGGFGTVLITLAGRELVTNFLSSIMIHATRPFMVNEWIQTKIDGYEVSGTVEHVGWWEPSIIRGDDREAIYIPNHKFTVTVLRNLSQKTHWRIKTYFAISHLDVNKIGDIISTMRKVVAKHPQIEQRHLHRRIFLEEIKQDSNALMIMVSIFVKTSHFEEYLRVREMVILDLLKVISHYGARLATPLRSVQRVYDETEARGSGFREYGASKTSNSRPFLLLSQLETDQVQEVADLSPATVLEVSPSTQSSPSPSPLKEMNAETSPTQKSKMEVDEGLADERKPKPPLSTPTPSNASPSSKPVKGMKEKNYESDDDFSSLDSHYASDDELRVPDVPQKSFPAEPRSKPRVSSPSTANAKSSPTSPTLSPSAVSSSSSTPSVTPSVPSSPSPSEVRSTLEGLDSMGLNSRDITLLGAAFEKSHANIPQSTLDSTSAFSKATDLGVVSVELEEVISSRSPTNVKSVVKETEKEEKKSEPTLKVANAAANSTSTASPSLNPPTPSSPSLSETSSPKNLGDNKESSEQDFWHAPLPSSSSPPSSTSFTSPTVENEFASLQSSPGKDGNSRKTVDAGKVTDDTQNKDLDSSINDSTLVASSPPTPSTNSAPVSPIIQSVEENIVLDVAIHGLKKTLPLDDDLSAIGTGTQFPQDASSSSKEIDGKEKELKMSVATASKPPASTSPQESNKGEGQLKDMDR